MGTYKIWIWKVYLIVRHILRAPNGNILLKSFVFISDSMEPLSWGINIT